MKMQRRSFLKTVGATLAGTLGLGATKSLPKAVVPKFATGGVVGLDRFPVQPPPGKAVTRFPGYDPRCAFNLRSVQCDYKGRAMICDKTFAGCQMKGNSQNFGGFPPAKEIRIEVNAMDSDKFRRFMMRNKKDVARIVTGV